MKQLSERKEEAESDENRRKQGKIFRSLLAVLMLTAMLVTSVLQSVFAGDYVAGTMGNLTLTVQQADEEGNQTPLPNVGLTIYKVGSVNFDGNVHFVLDEALAAAAIDFDSITTAEGWYEAAGQLADMISSGSVDVWGCPEPLMQRVILLLPIWLRACIWWCRQMRTAVLWFHRC